MKTTGYNQWPHPLMLCDWQVEYVEYVITSVAGADLQSLGRQPTSDVRLVRTCTPVGTLCQAHSYLPSRWASPPFGRYSMHLPTEGKNRNNINHLFLLSELCKAVIQSCTRRIFCTDWRTLCLFLRHYPPVLNDVTFQPPETKSQCIRMKNVTNAIIVTERKESLQAKSTLF